MTWGIAPAPRTWVAGEKVQAQFGNDTRDQLDYLKGAQAPDATYVTLTAGAAIGDELLSVVALDDLDEEIPVGTVLRFRPGTHKAARVQFTVARGDDSIAVYPLPVALDPGDYAPWPKQEDVELDAALKVASGLGWLAAVERGLIRNEVGTLNSLFRLLASHATAMADAHYCEIRFNYSNGLGVDVDLAKIRAFRDGSPNSGTIYFYVATAGVLPGSPQLVIRHTRRIGVNTTGPNYALDISGDMNAAEYVGLNLWREQPAGTFYHVGSAEVTNQIISTVATGTAPISCGSGAQMVKNLNVDLLQGKGWPGAAVQGNGTVSVVTLNTDYTVCSCTLPAEAGLYWVTGAYSGTLAANDAGAEFSANLTGAARDPSARMPATSDRVHVTAFTLISATASQVVNLVARKAAGTGSTSVTGWIEAVRFGF